MSTPSAGTTPGAPLTYEAFGPSFFEHAVTEQRILGVLDELLDSDIAVGPIGVGPGRLVKASATGRYGAPEIVRTGTRPLEYRVTVPASLTFTLDLQVETQRFKADLLVPLVLRATAAEPLLVVIEVVPPHASQLTVKVRAEGLRATVVQKVADVDYELRRFLATYVARELTKPYVENARRIDVAALMDRAWSVRG